MLETCFFISLAYSWCFTPKFTVKNTEHLPIWRAIDFIAPFELKTKTPTYTAYMDTSWRYSIWYWTRSFEGEVISAQEAYRRYYAIVSQSTWIVKRDFPYANNDQIIALTSLYYNCWNWYKRVKYEWFKVYREKWFCRLKWFSWLDKRRDAEMKLIFE